jgi:hypothetical protein
VLLARLWVLRRDVVVDLLTALYRRDSSSVVPTTAAVLAVGQFEHFLNLVPDMLALDAACTAARREEWDLKKWLEGRTMNAGNAVTFVRSIFRFLVEKANAESSYFFPSPSPGARHIILSLLAKLPTLQGPDLVALQKMRQIYQEGLTR